MDTIRRTPAAAAWFALAGTAFVLYPALRPWSSEQGTAGAEAFGSTAWVASHALGMLGFVAVAFGLRAAARRAPWPWGGRPVAEAESRAWLAVALLLPYYGAEAYGLHAVGRHVTEHGDTGVLEIADAFRYQPLAVTTFTAGLVLLVLVGGRLAHGLWHAGSAARAGGLLTGVGLATYLPQFFTAPEVRVAHGVLLGAGLLLVAATASRGRQAPATATSTATSPVTVP